MTRLTAIPQLADHEAYVSAVGRALESRDITVQEMTKIISKDGRRQATLKLHPGSDLFAISLLEQAIAYWDEETGWGLSLAPGRTASRLSEGTGALPDPDAVAAWVAVALTHPALAAHGPDQVRFRDHTAEDAAFEARLASYPPSR